MAKKKKQNNQYYADGGLIPPELMSILGMAGNIALPGLGTGLSMVNGMLAPATFNPVKENSNPYGLAMGGVMPKKGDTQIGNQAFQVNYPGNQTDGKNYGNVNLDKGEVVMDNYVFSDKLGFAKPAERIAKALAKNAKQPKDFIKEKTEEMLNKQKQNLMAQNEQARAKENPFTRNMAAGGKVGDDPKAMLKEKLDLLNWYAKNLKDAEAKGDHSRISSLRPFMEATLAEVESMGQQYPQMQPQIQSINNTLKNTFPEMVKDGFLDTLRTDPTVNAPTAMMGSYTPQGNSNPFTDPNPTVVSGQMPSRDRQKVYKEIDAQLTDIYQQYANKSISHDEYTKQTKKLTDYLTANDLWTPESRQKTTTVPIPNVDQPLVSTTNNTSVDNTGQGFGPFTAGLWQGVKDAGKPGPLQAGFTEGLKNNTVKTAINKFDEARAAQGPSKYERAKEKIAKYRSGKGAVDVNNLPGVASTEGARGVVDVNNMPGVESTQGMGYLNTTGTLDANNLPGIGQTLTVGQQKVLDQLQSDANQAEMRNNMRPRTAEEQAAAAAYWEEQKKTKKGTNGARKSSGKASANGPLRGYNGYDPNGRVWADDKGNLHQVKTKSDVEAYQTYLKGKGKYDGNVDSKWGIKTERGHRLNQGPVARIDVLGDKLKSVTDQVTLDSKKPLTDLGIKATTAVQQPNAKPSFGSRFKDNIGDILQGVEVGSKLIDALRPADKVQPQLAQMRQIDSAPMLRRSSETMNASLTGSNSFRPSSRNALLSNLYAQKLNQDSSMLSQIAGQNKQLAGQTEQFNIGQKNYASDLNAQNMGAKHNALTAAFTSVGNTGRALNDQRSNDKAQAYMAEAYQPIWDFFQKGVNNRLQQGF